MIRFITCIIFCFIFSLQSQTKLEEKTWVIELPGDLDYRYAGFILAQEKGLFKEAGLDVKLTFGETQESIQKRVETGETHFSVCGSEIMVEHAKGKPLIALMPIFQRDEVILVTKYEEGVSDWLSSKKGQKLGLRTKNSFIIKETFEKERLKISDFETVHLSGDPVKSLLNGEVDLVEMNYLIDIFNLKESGQEYRIYAPENFGVEMYGQIFYTNRHFYKKAQKQIESLNEVLVKGWNYVLENPKETVELFVKKYGFEGKRKILHHQEWTIRNRLILANLVPLGSFKNSRLERIKSLFVKNGLLPADYDTKELYHKKEKLKRGVLSTYYLEISIGLVIVVSILVAMFIFNRKLSKMVNRRTGELAETNWQLNKLNDELEDRINGRTAELQEALKETEVASKAKSTFLANMTHEIRTPMNSILGFAQIMKEKSTDQDMKKYLETISSSGQSLLRIINDVLDISRVESGKFTLDYSRFNILRLIEETMSIFSQEVQGKNITLKFDHSDECPEYVYLDKDRLRQVLTNIIGNAIKFTEEGLVEVKLSLAMVGPKEADVKIEVKDTGIGIPQEKFSSIFAEFEQVDDIHLHYGGTGLGLAISKKIVTMLNGEISVKSELYRGSDFTILLKDVGIVDHADEKEESNKIRYYFEPAKVMVVDQCLETRQLFEAYLSVTRLTVRAYESAFDAIKDLEDFKPNLVITEINLRSMDGFQLAEEIRSLESYAKIPIIAVSSITHTGSRQKFRIFNGFLKKPISINEFYQSISHFLPCRKINKNLEVKEIVSDRCTLPEGGESFTRYISKEIRDKCSEIMKYQVINDYKSLAQTLKVLADEKDLSDLKSWLSEFNENLEFFNFTALNRQLEYLMNSKGATS